MYKGKPYLGLWYYYHTVIVEITHKIRTSFITLASKKATIWRLKQSQSNDKILWEVSYHV